MPYLKYVILDLFRTYLNNGISFASYILGHAICKGYVDGIDSKLNDWPTLENTLYYDQKIIDVINILFPLVFSNAVFSLISSKSVFFTS